VSSEQQLYLRRGPEVDPPGRLRTAATSAGSLISPVSSPRKRRIQYSAAPEVTAYPAFKAVKDSSAASSFLRHVELKPFLQYRDKFAHLKTIFHDMKMSSIISKKF
jgi:hypothetical protein